MYLYICIYVADTYIHNMYICIRYIKVCVYYMNKYTHTYSYNIHIHLYTYTIYIHFHNFYGLSHQLGVVVIGLLRPRKTPITTIPRCETNK